jgi:hypothetical protein
MSNENIEEPLVHFVCKKEGSKLRIHIITQGYNMEANCQFPRNIRIDGGKYQAPASAVSFSRGPAGKFFYRVKKDKIIVLDETNINDITNLISNIKIYEDDDPTCVICMDNEKSIILMGCGHYVMCEYCTNIIIKKTNKCPICRTNIFEIVKRSEINL